MQDPEKLFNYSQRILEYEVKLSNAADALDGLGELLAMAEREVRKVCLEFMDKTPETRKMSIEKIEILSAITPQQKETYYGLVYYRQKMRVAEIVLDTHKAAMYAIKSLKEKGDY